MDNGQDMNKKAVFLDRDGVINRRIPDAYVRSWSEFELLPGVVEALADLTRAGATLFVVTNQRGVARGMVDAADLADIHERLAVALRAAGVDLGGIYTCPHEIGVCDCRKPGGGLFIQAQEAHPWIRFTDSHMVGDSISDAQAAHTLGAHVWLVGNGAAPVAAEATTAGVGVDGIAPSLADLVRDGELLARVHVGRGGVAG